MGREGMAPHHKTNKPHAELANIMDYNTAVEWHKTLKK
jgi:hypothetical protein